MDELAKVDRVIRTKAVHADYRRLLVIDASTGQNAFRQAEVFQETVGLDGLVLAKYDGAAKGGVLVPISRRLEIPACSWERVRGWRISGPSTSRSISPGWWRGRDACVPMAPVGCGMVVARFASVVLFERDGAGARPHRGVRPRSLRVRADGGGWGGTAGTGALPGGGGGAALGDRVAQGGCAFGGEGVGDGVLSRVSRYDEGGRLLVEEFYREGEFSERVRYEYEGARVVRRVWEGVDGGTSTEEFRYDREGRLREVRAVPEKGVDRYVQVGGRLVEEWHGDGGSGFLVRYGRSGEVVEREEWEGGRLVWVRTYRYGEGGVCEGWVEERPAEGAVVEVRCDGEGRPVEEVWRREGVSVRRVVYGYEGGRVVWEREVTEGLVRESRYGYEGDRVVWEEVWENGVRVMRREFGRGGGVGGGGGPGRGCLGAPGLRGGWTARAGGVLPGRRARVGAGGEVKAWLRSRWRVWRWVGRLAVIYLLRGRRKKTAAASLLTWLGVVLGVATLVTVLSVMNGFQSLTIDSLVEVASFHVRVYGAVDAAEVERVVGEGVVVPQVEVRVLAGDLGGEVEFVEVRGVPEGMRERDPGFARVVEVREGVFRVGEGRVVVGQELAYELGVGWVIPSSSPG